MKEANGGGKEGMVTGDTLSPKVSAGNCLGCLVNEKW